MKAKKTLAALVVMAVTAGSGAMANEIYKWTDEDGTVHYGDRPTGDVTEERVALTYRRTTSASVERQVQAMADYGAAREEANAARSDAAQQAAEAKAEEEARKQRCEKYRAQLETMLQARRLYREDENGERDYLDDQQRQEARTKAEELIAENCTS